MYPVMDESEDGMSWEDEGGEGGDWKVSAIFAYCVNVKG